MSDSEKKKIPITITKLLPEDEQAFLTFIKENLASHKKFSPYWKWRKDDLKASGGEIVVIARKENSDILGCVGVVPVDVWFSGEKIEASWQQDSLVSSAARGMGIGRKLIKEAGTGWKLSLAKGTSKIMYGLRKSSGYKDVPYSNYLLRVCRMGKTEGAFFKKIAFLLLRLWSFLWIQPFKKNNVPVQEIDRFDDDVDELFNDLSKEKILRPSKGKTYLNWRYVSCPGKRYVIFKAGTETLRGFIVATISGEDSQEGWIVDMMCRSNDTDCAYALIKIAMGYFNRHQVSRIWCFATLPEARKWFYRFGFVATNRSPRFTWISNQKEVDQLVSEARWDFWHGDGDIELYM